MAFYMDEEQVWKCQKHPSKRRKTGICPKCLRDRLVILCPNCARPRPCSCCPAPPDSPSASSSFSLFSFSRNGSHHDTNGSNTLQVDPTLRKSRSVATSFLRSRSRNVGTTTGRCEVETVVKNNSCLPPKVNKSKLNLWWMFNKSKKCDVHDDNGMEEGFTNYSMMMRSRSVAVGARNRFAPASSKHKGWYFPSPINAFRHLKSPRSVPVT